MKNIGVLIDEKILLLIFMLNYCVNAVAENIDDIPWEKRTWKQKFVESSYEDQFTFKNKEIFFKDPFIWVVSREFSERFGMPKQWIDDELKGALAVAWRITNRARSMCGHGNNPSACWGAYTCQMDIYVDNAAPIPWRFNDVERDFFWYGMTSMDYVPKRGAAPSRARYLDINGDLGSRGRPFYNTSWEYKNGTKGGGAFWINHFDRAFAPGVTVLGFDDACLITHAKGRASVKFFTDEEQKRTRGRIEHFVHSVDFPAVFMQRITELDKQAWEESNKTNAVYQDIVKQYLPHQK